MRCSPSRRSVAASALSSLSKSIYMYLFIAHSEAGDADFYLKLPELLPLCSLLIFNTSIYILWPSRRCSP